MPRYVSEAMASAAFTAAWYLSTDSDGEFAVLTPGLALAVILLVIPSRGWCNPAVSLTLWVTGRMATADAMATVTAQLLGAACAAAAISRATPLPPTGDPVSPGAAALFAEGIVVAALTWVVLGARPGRSDGYVSRAWLFGAVVSTASVVLAGTSVTAFNPSTALAAAVSGRIGWPAACALVATALTGAAAAAALACLGTWPERRHDAGVAVRVVETTETAGRATPGIPRPRSATPAETCIPRAADTMAARSL